MEATEDDERRSLCSREGHGGRLRPSHLLNDLDRHAAVLARGARANHRAQGPRDPALAADHLADVVRSDVEQEHELSLSLLGLDPDGLGLVDQLPGELCEQLSQSPWP